MIKKVCTGKGKKFFELNINVRFALQDGLMFWSDWGHIPRIERAGMDGNNRVTIVDHNIHWPNGITLALEARRLYLVEAKMQHIW